MKVICDCGGKYAFDATPEMVLMQMRYMVRGIQLRRSLPYLRDGREFAWSGSRKWRVRLAEDDYVDWGIPAAPRRKASH